MRIALIYLIICITLVLLFMKDVSKQEKVSNILLMIFIPFIGLFLVLLLHFTRSNLSKELKEEENIKQIVLFTDRMDTKKDLRTISIEESLIVNETHEKRNQILELMKGNTSDYIDILNLALNDEDRETAHYAATALAEIKRNLDIEMQRYEVQFAKSKSDIMFLIKYEKVLDEYVNSNLINENILRKYIFVHIDVLKTIISKKNDNPIYFKTIINKFFAIGELQEAKTYCDLFIETHEVEDAYISYLKYCFTIKDKVKFEYYFKLLQESKINISNEGLNIIRFWMKG